MAIKHYCDVCEEEKLPHQLSKFHFGPYPGDTDTDLEADVCVKCKERVLAPFKQFRTTQIIAVPLPQKVSKRRVK